MNKLAQNIIFFILSTVVGAWLMWAIYRGFDFHSLAEVFVRRSNYIWIILALLAGLLANVFRALRWRMLLHSSSIQISVRRSVELIFISYLINAVTPRLGELTRSFLVRRKDSTVTMRALGTVVVEKLSDVACLLVLVGIAVPLRWERSKELVGSMTEGLKISLPNFSGYIVIGCIVCGIIGLTFPFRKYFSRLFANLWQGCSAIARLESPLGFVALCIAIWFCNFLQLYWLVPCFEGMEGVGFTDMIYIFAVASVGVLVPTPAGAGPWHYAVVKTLTTLYHVTRPVAQSYAFITHGLKTMLVMLLGVLGYASYYESLWHWLRKRVFRKNRQYKSPKDMI